MAHGLRGSLFRPAATIFSTAPSITSSLRGLPTTTTPASTSTPNASFSTTSSLQKRKNAVQQLDKRITLIRYFLYHPRTPRPLKFSRTRYLRHWTIHRAWNLYQAKLRREKELELQRQYQAMAAACEELRTGCGERGAKLFRISMNKRGVFTDLFPIEYARMQTEYPPKDGWNHAWKRPGK
ncbi:hypothetical protein VTN49DRAFT_6799 [Thermomyces lanuginosus]|uniref:mitochondrial 54S ribosomal protein mL40 n=1 Tax=Thermomyces lanuginosus TaxID=5541 RepID=UPI003742B9EA